MIPRDLMRSAVPSGREAFIHPSPSLSSPHPSSRLRVGAQWTPARGQRGICQVGLCGGWHPGWPGLLHGYWVGTGRPGGVHRQRPAPHVSPGHQLPCFSSFIPLIYPSTWHLENWYPAQPLAHPPTLPLHCPDPACPLGCGVVT